MKISDDLFALRLVLQLPAKALKADTLKNQAEVLVFAARLAADETMHWTALSDVLAQAEPAKALSFGA
ncbi:hypothetical protein [Azoarcus sp. KH32C]|uniref:hypothetical protein n=1 Tax=Azoarcus sp. KH32C TaxID=748247 RepID=UPI0002385F11|nr:hypothetical protein [Azoarcus sp. KH32C]BAL25593.1 hypothetical protein AZKH_3304 [Azoarcus sp. KH32C]